MCQLQQSSMAGGGGAVSLEAFNALRESLELMVNVSQVQAENVARLERVAEVSELRAQRAKSDKDGKEAGIHTQMEILEEALYGLEECSRLVEQCVEGDEGAKKSQNSG